MTRVLIPAGERADAWTAGPAIQGDALAAIHRFPGFRVASGGHAPAVPVDRLPVAGHGRPWQPGIVP